MKQIILSLMGAIIACATFAANCVSVKQINTDYAGQKITISLTRAGCTGDATNHRNTVWVFVDYRTVTGANKGTWTRAAISAASAGTVVNSGSSKGVWIYGANGTQTVTLTLSGMPAKFDWCAFATDCPPAALLTGGTYRLTGSPPFTINGTATLPDYATTCPGTVCITAITDRTGCPGTTGCASLSPGTIASGVEYVSDGGQPEANRAGIPGIATATGGCGSISYQWYRNGIAVAGATSTAYTPPVSDFVSPGTCLYTRGVRDNCGTKLSAGSWKVIVSSETVSLCGLQIKLYDAGVSLPAQTDRWCPSGWRWPAVAELKCMYTNRLANTQPASYNSRNTGAGNYGCNSSNRASTRWQVNFGNGCDEWCSNEIYFCTNYLKVRCVK